MFFKAVRAGLAVKHPYLSHTGRASNAEKQPTSPAQRVAMKMGVAIKMGRRLGKRVSVLAYGRMGVWRSKTAFRHGYYDQEVSTKFMTLWKRRYADSPIRRHVSPSRRLSEDVKGVKDDEDCGCGSAPVDHCQRFRLTPRVSRI